MRHHLSLSREILASFLLATSATVAPLVGPSDVAGAATSGTESGSVFLDKDSDGAIDTGEGGVASVEVKAYDSGVAAIASDEPESVRPS